MEPQQRDEQLWQLAKKRASFKRHVVTYLIVNAFLWATWYFTGNRYHDFNDWEWHHYPWPIWTTIGWGIGLAFHFAGAYIFHQTNSVENEYQKLKNKQNK